jgi:uncharacterized DUF497 family protein
MDAVEFDWDAENLQHIARHDVLREEAEQFFRNGYIVIGRVIRNEEERVAALGQTDAARLLSVIFTVRNGLLRVVTAYTMRRNMRKKYLEARAKLWSDERKS